MTTDKASSREHCEGFKAGLAAAARLMRDIASAKESRSLDAIGAMFADPTAADLRAAADRVEALFAAPRDEVEGRAQVLERYFSCHGADYTDRSEAERVLVYILDGPDRNNCPPLPSSIAADRNAATGSTAGGRLTDKEQRDQAGRCSCRGTDDLCPCQNAPDAHTRDRRAAGGAA